jgi:predicted DNA-binding protein YlxM (UPF0122 family)
MTTLETKRNAELPAYASTYLEDLRNSETKYFLAYVLALRERGWPLRAIGDPFNVTRAAVQNWVQRANENEEIVALSNEYDAPEIPLDMRGSRLKVVRLVPDVPVEDRDRIRQLTVEASVVKRWTPENSSARAAALELEELLYYYSIKQNVSVTKLAKYAGVTRRAVQQRIEKERKRVGA